MTLPLILKCDVAGLPVRWINWQKASCFYARKCVRWEAGEKRFVLRGGVNKNGEQTTLELNSIIAVADKSRSFDLTPRLTNRGLFERDQNICLYCGSSYSVHTLTRDHVQPKSRGGANEWENCVSACKKCNSYKGDRTPEQAGMKLLAVPYAPSLAEYLILSNRRILADQMEFLKGFSKNKSILERLPKHQVDEKMIYIKDYL